MKLHEFRQDLQDYQDLFWTRISFAWSLGNFKASLAEFDPS